MDSTLGEILSGTKKPTHNSGRGLSVCDVRDCGNLVELAKLFRFPPMSRLHERVSWWTMLYGRVNFELNEKSAPLTAICQHHFSDPSRPLAVPDRALPQPTAPVAPVPTALLREQPPPSAYHQPVRTYSRAAAKRATVAARVCGASSAADAVSRYKPIAPAKRVNVVPPVAGQSATYNVLSTTGGSNLVQTGGSNLVQTGSSNVIQLQLPPVAPVAPTTSFQLMPSSNTVPAAQPYQLVQAVSSAPPTANSHYVLTNGNLRQVVLMSQQQRQQAVTQVTSVQPMVLVNAGRGGVIQPRRPQQVQVQTVAATPLRPRLWPTHNQPLPNIKLPLPPLPSGTRALSVSKESGRSAKSAGGTSVAIRPVVSAASRLEIASVESLTTPDAAAGSDDELEVLDQAWGIDTAVKPKQEVVDVGDDSDCEGSDPGVVDAEDDHGGQLAMYDVLLEEPKATDEARVNGSTKQTISDDLSKDKGDKSESSQVAEEVLMNCSEENLLGSEVKVKEEKSAEQDLIVIPCDEDSKKGRAPPPSTIRLKPLSQLTTDAPSQHAGESSADPDPEGRPLRVPTPPEINHPVPANAQKTADKVAVGGAAPRPLPPLSPTEAAGAPAELTSSSQLTEPLPSPTPPLLVIQEITPKASAKSKQGERRSHQKKACKEPPPSVSIELKRCAPERGRDKLVEPDPQPPPRVPTPPGISLGDGGIQCVSEAELMLRSMRAREAQAQQARKQQLEVLNPRAPSPEQPSLLKPLTALKRPLQPTLLMRRTKLEPPPESAVLAKRSRLAVLLPTASKHVATGKRRHAGQNSALAKRRARLERVRRAVADGRRRWEKNRSRQQLVANDQRLSDILRRLLPEQLFWSLDVVADALNASSVRDTVAGLIQHFIVTERLGSLPPESGKSLTASGVCHYSTSACDDGVERPAMNVEGFSLPQGLSITPLSAPDQEASQDEASTPAVGVSSGVDSSEALTVTPLISETCDDEGGSVGLAPADPAPPPFSLPGPAQATSVQQDPDRPPRRTLKERRRFVKFVCCRVCGAAGFSSWVQVDTHMTGHHAVRNILVASLSYFDPGVYALCRHCSTVTTTANENIEHTRRWHPGRECQRPHNASLFCISCDQVVGTTGQLLLDIERNRGGPCDPTSSVCPSIVDNRPKVLRCTSCRVHLTTVENVYSHARTHRLGGIASWARCMLCHFEGVVDAVREHVLRAHRVRSQLLGCSVCPQFGTDQWTAAEQHVSRQHGSAPPPALTVCRLCCLTLAAWPSFLKRHRALHDDGKLAPSAAASASGEPQSPGSAAAAAASASGEPQSPGARRPVVSCHSVAGSAVDTPKTPHNYTKSGTPAHVDHENGPQPDVLAGDDEGEAMDVDTDSVQMKEEPRSPSEALNEESLPDEGACSSPSAGCVCYDALKPKYTHTGGWVCGSSEADSGSDEDGPCEEPGSDDDREAYQDMGSQDRKLQMSAGVVLRRLDLRNFI